MGKPTCFGHFGENFANPNCDICHLRVKCYEEWNQKDKVKQKVEEENAKPWCLRKPLKELFPEACSTCE